MERMRNNANIQAFHPGKGPRALTSLSLVSIIGSLFRELPFNGGGRPSSEVFRLLNSHHSTPPLVPSLDIIFARGTKGNFGCSLPTQNIPSVYLFSLHVRA